LVQLKIMMKNKLWCFGDSYTAGIIPDLDHFPPYKEYLKYLGIKKEEFPTGWTHQLASKLDMNLEVHAVGGTSNEETLIRLYQNIPNFKKDDIVIIQWSYMNRFLWANSESNYNFENLDGNPFGKFKRASIHTQLHEDYEFTPADVFKNIGVNKSLKAWTTQTHYFEDMLKYISDLVGFSVYFWSTDDIIHISKKQEILEDSRYILSDIVVKYSENLENEDMSNLFLESIRELGATSIYQETNGKVKDPYHLGIEGNKVFCDLIYNHLYNSK
jgi:hypothetical protein